MLAALIEESGQLAVREVSNPQIAGDYDVVCDLLYGSVCTGTDHHLVAGTFPWPPANLPAILGHESIGRAARLGSKVRHVREGDLITRVGAIAKPGEYDVCWGGFAQQGIARDWRAMQEDGIDASVWRGHRVQQVLPADSDPRAATMLITWRETWSYLTRIGVKSNHSVLVMGSGGNGLAFVAHAHNLGAAQIAMLGTAKRENLARQIGTTHYVDYRDPDRERLLRDVAADGFDLIIDAIGSRSNLDLALSLVQGGGGLAVYGLDDFGQLLIDVGKARAPLTLYPNGYDEAEAHDEVMRQWQTGKLDANHWIDVEHPVELSQLPSVFDGSLPSTSVKTLVRISPDSGDET